MPAAPLTTTTCSPPRAAPRRPSSGSSTRPTVPTVGGGLPVVYFRKGTSGAYSSNQCSFASGGTYNCTIDYSLVTGGSVTAGDTIQYYVAAQDTPGNVSVNPSAGASGLTPNPP